MSYCRWSSDDWQCDVYVYEHVNGGWVTHVAGRRHVFKDPLPPLVPEGDAEAWMARYVKVSALVKDAELVTIGLPHDGETFSDRTPGACADTLEMLRAAGYNVPQYAIDTLREEHRELYRPEEEPK